MFNEAFIHLSDYPCAFLVCQPTILQYDLRHKLRSMHTNSESFEMDTVKVESTHIDLIGVVLPMDHAEALRYLALVINFIEVVDEMAR